jgi:hypothetical protein
MPRYSVEMAGIYGVGFVIAHRFVGLIKFRAWLPSPSYQAAGLLAVRR